MKLRSEKKQFIPFGIGCDVGNKNMAICEMGWLTGLGTNKTQRVYEKSYTSAIDMSKHLFYLLELRKDWQSRNNRTERHRSTVDQWWWSKNSKRAFNL